MIFDWSKCGFKKGYVFLSPRHHHPRIIPSMQSESQFILNMAPWERCWQAAVGWLIWQEGSKMRLSPSWCPIFFAQSGCVDFHLCISCPWSEGRKYSLQNCKQECISILQTGGMSSAALTKLREIVAAMEERCASSSARGLLAASSFR